MSHPKYIMTSLPQGESLRAGSIRTTTAVGASALRDHDPIASELWASLPRPLFEVQQHAAQRVDELVDLRPGNNQRRRHRDNVSGRANHDGLACAVKGIAVSPKPIH